MKTLYAYIDDDQDHSSRVLVEWNLCTAVAELHRLDIVHGDIASENVLIEVATSEVKLIDFDLTSFQNT